MLRFHWNIDFVRIKWYIGCAFLLLFNMQFAVGQNVPTSCPNFMMLNSPNVIATTGNTSNPFIDTGIVSGRHTLITQQGYDPNTGNALRLIPVGETSSIRIGNKSAGGEAESITYNFSVDPEHAILLLNFAVVLQNPDHSMIQQPRFLVRVMDAQDSLIEDCAEYNVYATAGIPGFYATINSDVLWRDWTKVGLNLSDFVGQTVKLQIVTYDCSLNGHYGYAYFTASCINNRLSVLACNGNQIILSAPEGFDYYFWNDGTTTSTDTINMGNVQQNISCVLTSATNCTFTLSATLSPDSILSTVDTVLTDTICQGDVYQNEIMSLPAQNVPGVFHITGNGYHLSDCGQTYSATTLNLTVLQRFYDVSASVCQTDSDFTIYGFHFAQNPGIGVHHYADTLLRNPSTYPCDSVVRLTLTVYPSVAIPVPIEGNATPCIGEALSYTVPGMDGLGTLSWEVPVGAIILQGGDSSTVNLFFNNLAQSGDVVFHVSNGCGAADISMQISPQMASSTLLLDTICDGNEYHENGFDLPIQQEGDYTYSHNFTNSHGCDSLITLRLIVKDQPDVQLESALSAICEGDYVRLNVLTGDSTYYSGNAPYTVQIGDVVCTNGDIVHSQHYLSSGDTALAVVFYVDASGQHGWAVDVVSQPNNCKWSNTPNLDVPNIVNASSIEMALSDTAGAAHSSYLASSNFPAGYHACGNGWYLPAVGQLRVLYTQCASVNNALSIIHYHINVSYLWSNHQQMFWSSSEADQSRSWVIQYRGMMMATDKFNSLYSVRRIRNF